MTPRESWNRVARTVALLLAAGSVPYWGFACSFGLLSGLVVLLAPLYVLLFQAALTTIVLALCLARDAYGAARVLGLSLALGPGFAASGWYASKWVECARAADSGACFEYLNGSPLLPIGVAGYALVSTAGAIVVLAVVRCEITRRSA